MEVDSVSTGADVFLARNKAKGGGFRPQHLGYTSTTIDCLLFLAAGFVSAIWMRPVPSDFLLLAMVLTSALLLVLFLVCCRITRIHDPVTLLRPGIGSHFRAVLCFGLPISGAVLVCLPFYDSAEPAAHGFMHWLKTFDLLAIGFAGVSRGVFLLASSRIVAKVFVPQRVAVVGSGEAARRLINWIEVTAPHMVQVIGVFDDRGRDRSAAELAGRLRGDTADLIRLYQQMPFDKIVIALPHSAEDRLLFLLRRLRQLPVDIVLAPDLIGFRSVEQGHADIAGLKLYSLAHRPIREPQRLVKGAIDRILAGAALLVLSPLLLLVSLVIKLDSPGPVFFRQPRQGLGDTLFDVYKFRTMHQSLGDTVGRQQTKREDPRITRIGAWLRRSSIDELPQLLNVLRGDMSLVGPRPHTPHMLIGDKLIFDLVDEYSFRHRVKPGITGLAQVNGYRGAIDTPEQLRARVDYDLYYIDHWSLWLDFKIICRTAAICVSGVNAF